MQHRLPEEDLDHIIRHTEGLWDEMRDKRIFITGGTGFFGSWLLESFAWANDRLHLNSSAVVLTRDPDAFSRKTPHLWSNPSIRFHAGDVRNFELPEGKFSHIIHAATGTDKDAAMQNPVSRFESMVQGTRQTLEFARYCGAGKFLFASSGAVYGKQPPELTHVPEEYSGAPETINPLSANGEAKRVSEFLCAMHAELHGFEAKIARCFAFVGPHLPLDGNFAIGNFIRDALKGGPILVNGDGTPYRSYLYAADLAIWLWAILFRGTSCRPYNVGSESEVTIAGLAREVAAAVAPQAEVRIALAANTGFNAERYVPSTRRAHMELGLRQHISLRDAIQRTAAWYSQRTGTEEVAKIR
jgi:nucleoside-diphosphate-sugar epimerase